MRLLQLLKTLIGGISGFSITIITCCLFTALINLDLTYSNPTKFSDVGLQITGILAFLGLLFGLAFGYEKSKPKNTNTTSLLRR